jgi:hypothetical protein
MLNNTQIYLKSQEEMGDFNKILIKLLLSSLLVVRDEGRDHQFGRHTSLYPPSLLAAREINNSNDN